ncbi:DNA polymerase [Facklamia hominis]|uniref:DNA polymerase n=1 Tax=Facklamia hominis TaxID=178214 RepID=UPI0029D40EE4|nr:DNA polymerase [Facklamia hominis]WPJ91057.1 DNA polymerase [Facklamia hominis]
MAILNIDIETYSEADLPQVGVYRYADDPSFDILLFSYAIDGGEVTCIDLTKGKLPQHLVKALLDPKVTKKAYNAQFERVCLSHYLFNEGFTDHFDWLDPSQWQCTMIHALSLGLPGSLGRCASYLNVMEQKDQAGTQLINYFSKPCKGTKRNGGRTRNLPEHDPEKWADYVKYNIQDVKTEMAIAKRLEALAVPDFEWEMWHLDQRINDRGVELDMDLAESAVEVMEKRSHKNLRRMQDLTGLRNPNSVAQLTDWLEAEGYPYDNLRKGNVEKALEEGKLSPKVKEVLDLRLANSNTSTKKYIVMEEAVCQDGRIRGLLQFYGASRTGRWAGRLLQVQNLPRNYLKSIGLARQLVKEKEVEAIELIFDELPEVLKQLLRTGIVAEEGRHFVISDYSAIEARVIAWLAGEEWAIQAFRDHGKIYEVTANQMFNLGGIENVTKSYRQRGKVATLALGYQGGVGALKAMGALDMGIPEEDLQPLVDSWRKANPNIVNFWYDVDKKAKATVVDGLSRRTASGRIRFSKEKGFLRIQLPSGRYISYPRPKLADGRFGQVIEFEGQGLRVGIEKIETYGGKLVENIVQATARDILAEGIKRIEKKGYPIVFHVHDEVVVEAPLDVHTEELNQLLATNPTWAEGLPLGAAGFETEYYMKD